MNLVIECARAHPDPTRIREAAGAVADWESVIGGAARHAAKPLLYWCLKQACPDLVPSAVLDQLRSYFQANAARNLRLTAELLSLVSQFQQAGLEVIPFKGPAVAWSLYQNPALREMSDLDLLVRPVEAERAVGLLTSAGYQCPYLPDLRFFRANREIPLISSSGVAVDLHWALAPAYLVHGLDMDGLWTRLAKVTLAGQPVSALANEDLLVFLCIHGAKHSWSSLHWLADLARLIDGREIDWHALIARARARNVSRIVFSGLLLAVDLLGASLPDAVDVQLRAHAAASDIAARFRKNLLASPPVRPTRGEEFRSQLRLLERPIDKFRFCWGHAVPAPADWQAGRLQASLFPLYYAFRPLRLMAKYTVLAARRLQP